MDVLREANALVDCLHDMVQSMRVGKPVEASGKVVAEVRREQIRQELDVGLGLAQRLDHGVAAVIGARRVRHERVHEPFEVALAAALAAAAYANGKPGTAFGGMLVVDGFATFFRVLVMAVGLLTVLSSYRFLRRQGAEAGEYHALLLFSIAGQCLMAAANDLIVIFIGLEISSIASYVLAGYFRDDKRANEAALKYFLLGSFATAFFLYGVALIYGATGTINLGAVARAWRAAQRAAPPLFVGVAAALMFVGLGFKVSAAPFQIWAPDVYQGAPTPVAAFLSAGPKAAAFAIFLRIFMTAFEPIGAAWEPLVWISALLSMTIGNFAALLQTERQAHAGLQLHRPRRLRAGGPDGALGNRASPAAMFYLAAYAFMNVGAFAVVSHLSGKGEKLSERRGFRRPGPEAAAHRGHARHFPALADRRAAHRRLLRQVLHLQSRSGIAPGVADRAGPAEQRRGGLLLPAHPGDDVFPRAGRSRMRSRTTHFRPAPSLGAAALAPCSWASSPLGCWISRGRRRSQSIPIPPGEMGPGGRSVASRTLRVGNPWRGNRIAR